ncbi:MAG: glycosyltransferase family 39 protein [Gorillibacterium sp.]|nr:glycosyltransferase family 39 protein [Gorillibacterium sp.]
MPATHSAPKRLLYLVLAVTLILKIVLVLSSGPDFNYQSDDREYLRSASILLEQGTLTYNDPTRPSAFITPAYPGFLAILIKLTGSIPAAAQSARILQAVMITIAMWLLYGIGTRLFDAKSALLSVILCSVYPPLWLISNFIFTESLFILVLFALITVVLRAEEHPTLSMAILFGLIWAAAVYVRPTIALWPGIVLLVLAARKRVSFAQLARCGLTAALVFSLCLAPWWARNYRVSGGDFIPLTKSSGNPLLLGTYPWTVPALFLDEQRTWHKTNNLWVNDQEDAKRAVDRLKTGFRHSFWTYFSWYTVGKFLLFWGDVFYWLPLPWIPLSAAIILHEVFLIIGFIGVVRYRRHNAGLIISLLVYMTVLHMIYLPHSRYSLPLMPILFLFASLEILRLVTIKAYIFGKGS